MAADGSANPFRDGRANLRDTARWMVSGAVGAATLIVGSSTISQLGSMEISCPRFWIAIGSLIAAAGLCWFPFIKAVDVLRSEVLTLRRFMDAQAGEFRQASDGVSGLLGVLPQGTSMQDFVRDYPAERSAAWKAAPDLASAEKAVADLDGRIQTCLEACISQLVAIRFERLVKAIKFPGCVILLTFLLFTWAANPPKDAVKLFDKPYAEALTAERIARLKAANVDPACYGPGARLVAVAGAEAGPQTAILIPPRPDTPACPLRKATLSAGGIVKVE